MKLYLIRHGETVYNREKRYQGQRDIPLSEEGRAALCPAPIQPPVVYTSPLSRAMETARILFPKAELIAVEGLREMCFGIFEGRNYQEMEKDPEYLEWVGSDCSGQIPQGENKHDFCARTLEALEPLVCKALEENQEMLVIVAHGGTQMAVMETLAVPRKPYHDWCGKNGCGWVLDVSCESWARKELPVLEEICCVRGGLQ